jgi:hypothetical protein
VSGPENSSSVHALLARVLTEPELLAALERRDFAALRRDLAADPSALEALAAIDTDAVRFYRRRLSRKRLETMENIFVASLPAARNAYGADALAADFWSWFQPPDTLSAHEVLAVLAAEWTRFATDLAGRGQLDWLGDLSRYELMRWRAGLAQAPPSTSASAPGPRDHDEGRNLVLAPGTEADIFAIDVPLLLRTALSRSPVASRRTMRLIMWCGRAGGVQTAEIGAAILRAVRACDGSRTIDQIAAVAGAGQQDAQPRIAATLRELVRAGALRLSGGADVAAEQQHPAGVQLSDGS